MGAGYKRFWQGIRSIYRMAAFFDGVNSSIAVAHHADLQPTGGLEIEVMIHPKSKGNTQSFIRKDGCYILQINGIRQVICYVYTAAGLKSVTTSALTYDRWTLLNMRYDGVTLTVKIDGVVNQTLTVNSPLTVAAWPLYFGARNGNQEYFYGGLDNIKLWGTNNINDPMTLRGEWSMEGNAADSSGNNRNGTPAGGTIFKLM